MLPHRNFPRSQLYRGFRRYLRDERRDLLQVTVGIGAAAAVIAVLNRGFFGGFLVGVLAMFLVAVILWNYLINCDGVRHLNGAWAEDWTRDGLRSAVKNKLAWQALDHISLQGGDVDHILITPKAVVAVETKFYGRAGRANYVSAHAREAERAATRVRGLLNTVRSHPHPVAPLLVVWGPGGRALPDVSHQGEVTVVKGLHLDRALTAFARGPLAQDHADELAVALRAYSSEMNASA